MPPARPKMTLGRLLMQPNTLVVGAILALIGFPALRDATSDPMRRNRYLSEADCRCDYGDRCLLVDGKWVGPWYARDAADRRADDPGAGQCRSHGGYARTWTRPGPYGEWPRPNPGGSRAPEPYHGPASIESGYRGGFGGTGRVRAAGS